MDRPIKDALRTSSYGAPATERLWPDSTATTDIQSGSRIPKSYPSHPCGGPPRAEGTREGLPADPSGRCWPQPPSTPRLGKEGPGLRRKRFAQSPVPRRSWPRWQWPPQLLPRTRDRYCGVDRSRPARRFADSSRLSCQGSSRGLLEGCPACTGATAPDLQPLRLPVAPRADYATDHQGRAGHPLQP
eukprot:scaffold742_cov263-Pinguiococcus_pyrenoidosus.AAC.13